MRNKRKQSEELPSHGFNGMCVDDDNEDDDEYLLDDMDDLDAR